MKKISKQFHPMDEFPPISSYLEQFKALRASLKNFANHKEEKKKDIKNGKHDVVQCGECKLPNNLTWIGNVNLSIFIPGDVEENNVVEKRNYIVSHNVLTGEADIAEFITRKIKKAVYFPLTSVAVQQNLSKVSWNIVIKA